MLDRREYEKELQERLDKWGESIEKLRRKAEQEEEEQLNVYNIHEKLRDMHFDAQQKLHDLKQTDEDFWQEKKEELEKKWDELGEAVDSALSRANIST